MSNPDSDPRNCYECPSQRTAPGPLDATTCSPSSIMNTLQLREKIAGMKPENRAERFFARCIKLERENLKLRNVVRDLKNWMETVPHDKGAPHELIRNRVWTAARNILSIESTHDCPP